MHFDKIDTSGITRDVFDPSLEARREQAAKREADWLAKSVELPGVPGRCVLVESEDTASLVDVRLWEALKSHVGAKLYYYNDIQCLSGSAGYVVVQDGQVVYKLVTMVS